MAKIYHPIDTIGLWQDRESFVYDMNSDGILIWFIVRREKKQLSQSRTVAEMHKYDDTNLPNSLSLAFLFSLPFI